MQPDIDDLSYGVALHRDQDPYFPGVMIRAQGTWAEMEALIGTYPGHDCYPMFFDDYIVGGRHEAAFLKEYSEEDQGDILSFQREPLRTQALTAPVKPPRGANPLTSSPLSDLAGWRRGREL